MHDDSNIEISSPDNVKAKLKNKRLSKDVDPDVIGCTGGATVTANTMIQM